MTGNFDMLHEYAGIKPYKVDFEPLEDDWEESVIKQIDAVITIGTSNDFQEILGKYIFLVDLEGHRQDPLISEVLAKIKSMTSLFKVFGSYPRYEEKV